MGDLRFEHPPRDVRRVDVEVPLVFEFPVTIVDCVVADPTHLSDLSRTGPPTVFVDRNEHLL